MAMLPTLRHATPTLMCALLVFVYWKPISASPLGAALIGLPMCFFFVSAMAYDNYKQTQALQAELASLRTQLAGQAHAGAGVAELASR